MKQLNFSLLILFLLGSCKKLVEVDSPQGQITNNTAFSNDKNATRVVLGIYDRIAEKPGLLNGLISKLVGLYGGEIISRSGQEMEFGKGILTASTPEIGVLYADAYQLITTCNIVIDELSKSTTVSDSVKAMLTGEAFFIRALCYFYLVNLFGNVPLITSTDYVANRFLPRSSVILVYGQIEQDLLKAQDLLPDQYVLYDTSATLRTRPNKSASQALLARVFLFEQKWANAEKYASLLISSPLLNLETNLSNVFNATSRETIFQIRPVDGSGIALEAKTFVPTGAALPNYALTPGLIASFKDSDQRVNTWLRAFTIGGQVLYCPYKYTANKAVPEFGIVLRLAEQYLIRSEARAMQGNLEGATEDVNMLRRRAGLPNFPFSNTTSSFMDNLIETRKTELFAEWGHRFFDLKRWTSLGDSNDIFHPKIHHQLPPGFDTAFWKFNFPLPTQALLENPKLTQNEGYP